jgi:hypothetical protein
MSQLARYKSYIIIILLIIGLFLIFGLKYLYEEDEESTNLVNFIGQVCIIIATGIFISEHNKEESPIVSEKNSNIKDEILQGKILQDKLNEKNNKIKELENKLIEINNQIEINKPAYYAHQYNANDYIYELVKKLIKEKEIISNELNKLYAI